MFSPSRTTNLFLGVITTILTLAVLKLNRGIFIPLVLATFLVAIIQPVISWMQKRVPRWAAIPVVVLFLSLFLLVLEMLVLSNIQELSTKIPAYTSKMELLFSKGVAFAKSRGIVFDANWLNWKKVFAWGVSYTTSSISSVVGLLGQSMILLFLVIFLLLELPQFSRKFEVGFGEALGLEMLDTIKSISAQTQRYVLTKAVVSLVTGFSTYIISLLLGVDFPVLWGVLAFLLNFIPNLGSIIAVIPPAMIALLQYGSLSKALVVLLLLATIQTIYGNVLEPRIMGSSLDLSTFVVFVSMLLWGWLWGIVGMIIAVPLTAALKITSEHITALRPLAVFLSRLPTEPKQSETKN